MNLSNPFTHSKSLSFDTDPNPNQQTIKLLLDSYGWKFDKLYSSELVVNRYYLLKHTESKTYQTLLYSAKPVEDIVYAFTTFIEGVPVVADHLALELALRDLCNQEQINE